MTNMTTLNITIPDLQFRGLSDVLLEEWIAKGMFFTGLEEGWSHGHVLRLFAEWRCAAEVARQAEKILGIDRDQVGH